VREHAAPDHASAPASSTALVVRPTSPRALVRWRHAVARVVGSAARPRSLRGVALAGMLAVGASAVAGAWLAVPLVALGLVHATTATAREAGRRAAAERASGSLALPFALEVQPDQIDALDVRRLYRGVIDRHDELRRGLRAAPRLQRYLRDVLARCDAMVVTAGRPARPSNTLPSYVVEHDPDRVLAAVAEMAARSEHAVDPAASTTYGRAAGARGRQLTTVRELQGLLERIRARLVLVGASIDVVIAAVVKLRALDAAQVELTDDLAGGALAAIGEDLAQLEAMLADGIGGQVGRAGAVAA